jgi:hypothetical protein
MKDHVHEEALFPCGQCPNDKMVCSKCEMVFKLPHSPEDHHQNEAKVDERGFQEKARELVLINRKERQNLYREMRLYLGLSKTPLDAGKDYVELIMDKK